jgi:hypothetical protein
VILLYFEPEDQNILGLFAPIVFFFLFAEFLGLIHQFLTILSKVSSLGPEKARIEYFRGVFWNINASVATSSILIAPGVCFLTQSFGLDPYLPTYTIEALTCLVIVVPLTICAHKLLNLISGLSPSLKEKKQDFSYVVSRLQLVRLVALPSSVVVPLVLLSWGIAPFRRLVIASKPALFVWLFLTVGIISPTLFIFTVLKFLQAINSPMHKSIQSGNTADDLYSTTTTENIDLNFNNGSAIRYSMLPDSDDLHSGSYAPLVSPLS